MKNNKWELYSDHYESKYDVAHCLNYVPQPHVVDSQKTTSRLYSHDGGTRVVTNGDYIRAVYFFRPLNLPIPMLIVIIITIRGKDMILIRVLEVVPMATQERGRGIR